MPKAKPEPIDAPTADPETSAEAESETAADAKLESPAEESTAEDPGSADDLPDAEEARGASKTLLAFETHHTPKSLAPQAH